MDNYKIERKIFKINVCFIDDTKELKTYDAISRFEAYKMYVADSMINNDVAKWKYLKSFSIEEV